MEPMGWITLRVDGGDHDAAPQGGHGEWEPGAIRGSFAEHHDACSSCTVDRVHGAFASVQASDQLVHRACAEGAEANIGVGRELDARCGHGV